MSENHYSNARNKIDNFTIGNVFTIKKYFMEVFIQKMKPVVLGNYRRLA